MASPFPTSCYELGGADASSRTAQRRTMELFSIVESESENDVAETCCAAPLSPSAPEGQTMLPVTQNRHRPRPSPPQRLPFRNGKSGSSASISDCLKLYYPGGAAVATARARMRQQVRRDGRRSPFSGCGGSLATLSDDSLDMDDPSETASTVAYLFPQTPLSPAEFEKRRCTSAALSRAACLERQELSRAVSRSSATSPACVDAFSSTGPCRSGRSKSHEFACLLDLMKPSDYFETVARGEYYPDYSNTAPFRKDDETATATATFWGNAITDRGRSLMTSQRARAA